jgi:hypothetical protein
MVNIKDVARREAPVDMSMKDLTVPRTEGSWTVRRFLREHVANSELAEPNNDGCARTGAHRRNYLLTDTWTFGELRASGQPFHGNGHGSAAAAGNYVIPA